jgi:hypothetical protein
MKNIKLGDQVYEGVETVRLDTAEGGTVDYAPYEETFAAGRVEGYNAGKEAGLEEGFDNGKAAGIQAEYDRFWDAYRPKIPGFYGFFFAGGGWNDNTFYPKTDLVLKDGYSANSMFHQCGVTNLAERLASCGVVLDTSMAQYFNNMFNTSSTVRIPAIDCTNAAVVQYAFTGAAVQTIDKLTVNENLPLNDAFMSANALTNIMFEGTIGKNTNFQWCPLSVASMKSVITHLKNYAGTTDAAKYKVTFTDACWAALEADSSAPDGNTWRDYVETTLGWLT